MSAWTVSAAAPVAGARHLAAKGRVAPTRVATSAARVAPAPTRGATLRVSAEASEKNLEVMRKFSEQYAKGSGTYFCMDKSVTAVVIQGLAEHKDTLGSPLCPCRHYDDKEAEVASGFWNCPCVPMRERKECHCMLFLTEDNDFVGDEQTITMEEVVELSEGM
ncbi:ferredoxin thioredoxin reductase [Micromonas commoda]|uniref:Ferredoxin-thioredoxin reductase catalytic chain, chloroplastic n=1 Tax=Micromonas commoda (strain RCC299 / NOUM17 / CCMP2709) TaxID=296587 RepID=C1E7K6_MICCC|nr:ferredoxin thioredoxin reductase [Micromonas commoda]ACO63999.1 ferredoxin thioredoxin reductase [Micromonas commoda]|eukprot:XP_002502741.1 ferredoxin thioredoxin reductase [Micromonas commoda]